MIFTTISCRHAHRVRDGAENASNVTYGVRVSGNAWLGRFRLNYAATYATQEDYGHALLSYDDIDYYGGEFSATLGPTTARIGYELLEGGEATVQGNRPLPRSIAASQRRWRRCMRSKAGPTSSSTTPANGINDFNASITVNPRFRLDHLFNISLMARYHDFES